MGGNLRHFRSKYGMEEYKVMKSYDENCNNECEFVRVCEQIREMCSWGDRCDMTLFNKEECSTIIEFLCTGIWRIKNYKQTAGEGGSREKKWLAT